MWWQVDHPKQHIVLAPDMLWREHVGKKHDHVHDFVEQREHIAKKHVLGRALREHVNQHLPGPHIFLLREHVAVHVMLTKTHVMESILVGYLSSQSLSRKNGPLVGWSCSRVWCIFQVSSPRFGVGDEEISFSTSSPCI